MEKLLLELSIDDTNHVLAGLQELPYKIADRILKDIIMQSQKQMEIKEESK